MRIKSLFSIAAVVFAVSILFYGCNPQVKSTKSRSSTAGQKVHFEQEAKSAVLNPQSSIHYAQGFSVSYHQNYKLIEIFHPFADQSDTLRYMLLPRGSEPPDIYPKAQVVETPIHDVIVTGTPQVAFLEMLNAVGVIEGIVGAKYVYSPKVRYRLRTDKIEAFSPVGFSKEKILAMNPDLVIISGGQISQFNNYRLLTKMGIPVFVHAGWLETTPLGRAEWVKVMAALLNKEEIANKRFKQVAKRYNELEKLVTKKVDEKPTVISGLPYKGAWFVPGGNSYMAQYMKDAGAKYPWFENNETGGLKLDFEAVYFKGLKADIWINPGSAERIHDVVAKDMRFSDFKSVKTGHVYNRIKRLTPSGRNDFWETGVVRPDLVLHDLINIFHPGLLENDTLYFYQKLR